jgi:hypothetical protein
MGFIVIKGSNCGITFYFLANTGIRSGTETHFMKWEDIKEIELNCEEATEKILEIRMRATGKTRRTRQVMSQCNCVKWLQEWKELSPCNSTQDCVWYGMSKQGEPQKIATDLNKPFQLESMPKGEKMPTGKGNSIFTWKLATSNIQDNRLRLADIPIDVA